MVRRTSRSSISLVAARARTEDAVFATALLITLGGFRICDFATGALVAESLTVTT